MQFSWQPTRADLSEILRAYDQLRHSAAWVAVLGLLALAAWAYGFVADNEIVRLAAPSCFTPVLVIWLMRPLFARNLWRTLKPFRDPLWVTITPEAGIEICTPNVRAAHRWDNFTGVIETPNLFILQLLGYKMSFVYLAKRAPTSPAEIDELRAVLTSRTGTAPVVALSRGR